MSDKRDAPQGSEGRGTGARRGAAGLVSGTEFAGIGIQFALTLLVFVFAGVWFDNRLGTSPWLLLVSVFVGAAGGFYSMYRRVTAAQRRSKDVVAHGQSDGRTGRGR
jgi:F0F1-type ATP synthase assembly protein I